MESSTDLQATNTNLWFSVPSGDKNMPQQDSQKFNRNVMWTLVDITIYIGLDKFADGPCFTLKLNDMSKPINILTSTMSEPTSIDCWLNDLINNIPCVLMHFQLDGLVQTSDLLTMDDLSHLENSKFSSKVIRNLTDIILSFFNGGATKAGHTYWLYQGNTDYYIKLYDLTSTCADIVENETDTTHHELQFTVPVAILLYKLAKNMKWSDIMTDERDSSIKALLDTCVQLLPKEKYPQIVATSYYILSDIYMPADTNTIWKNIEPDKGHLKSSSTTKPSDKRKKRASKHNLNDPNQIQSNLMRWNHNQSLPPVSRFLDERCFMALHYIDDGLGCLLFLMQFEMQLKKNLCKQNEERNADMTEPISLYCETLNPKEHFIDDSLVVKRKWKRGSHPTNLKTNQETKKENGNGQPLEHGEDRSKILVSGKSGVSTSVDLKLQFSEKACLTYAHLANQYYVRKNFGKSLSNKHKKTLKVYLLKKAGDCYFAMANDINAMNNILMEFNSSCSLHSEIQQQFFENIEKSELPALIIDVDHLMNASANSFRKAFDMLSESNSDESVEEIGVIQYDLGITYLRWAENAYKRHKIDKSNVTYVTLAENSQIHFFHSHHAFQGPNDKTNLVKLLGKLGQFYCFVATTDCITSKRVMYEQSFHQYHQALKILGSRKKNPELWDSLSHELLTGMFKLTEIMMGELSYNIREENFADIISLLESSLELCHKLYNQNSQGPLKLDYLIRKYFIHGYLGKVFFILYVTNPSAANNSDRRKQYELHYDKVVDIAKELSDSIENATNCFVIQLQQLSHLCDNSQFIVFLNPIARIEYIRVNLNNIAKLKFIFELYKNHANKMTADHIEIMEHFHQMIQTILETAINMSKEYCTEYAINSYKTIYNLTLSRPTVLDRLEYKVRLAQHLVKVLDKCERILSRHKMP